MTTTRAPRFAMIGNAELNGIFRGRSIPAELVHAALREGLSWVPANVCQSPMNSIPPDNPFGPVGETRLWPDAAARLTLPADDARPAMDVYLADITTHDGAFWEACARSQARRALADLEAAGFRLKAGFEQEFFCHGLSEIARPAYSLAASRSVSGLAARVLDTLASAGTGLDQFMGEYGEHQFEVSSPVRPALRAADEAVMVRETIRDAARATGLHATFAPKPDLSRVGNGVHIHLSLWDLDGRPATAANGAPTPAAAAFAAGILKHLDAVMAYTTPSPNSFDRLKPSSWVGVFKCFGIRNREAPVRLAPRETAADGTHPSASLEFRVTDGAANPYLSVAALVRAGLAGLAEGLTLPESVDRDPATLEAGERAARGIVPVVGSLEEALAAAEPLASDWFGPLFWRAFSSVRRNEIADAARAGDDYPAELARVV